MSVIELLPPMPDLGPPERKPHPTIKDEYIINTAGILAVARSVASVESLAFYRAFCRRWEVVKHLPLPDGQRKQQALRQALYDVGKPITFLDMDKVANAPRPPRRPPVTGEGSMRDFIGWLLQPSTAAALGEIALAGMIVAGLVAFVVEVRRRVAEHGPSARR